jgi:hypothetical protein
MPWFAAHVIMYFQWKNGSQPEFTVWENVHLIEAIDSEEAQARAEAIGRRTEGDSRGTLRETDADGVDHPVTLVFAGVRKVLTVAHEREDDQLGTDDEVTFSQFVVDTQEAVLRLAAGDTITVTYSDL